MPNPPVPPVPLLVPPIQHVVPQHHIGGNHGQVNVYHPPGPPHYAQGMPNGLPPYGYMPPNFGHHPFGGYFPPHPYYPPAPIQPPLPVARLVDQQPQLQNLNQNARAVGNPNQENVNKVGVWSLDVIVVGKNVQSTFTIQTDLAWEDFYDRARAKFDDPNTKLAYKLTGDAARPPPFQLNDRTEYNKAMDRVVELCTRARTKKIEMSLFNHHNIETAEKKSGRGKKRARADDIPDTPEETNLAFRQLDNETRCEAHHGNCFVDRPNGRDSHTRLSFGDLEFWAKKISLGQATIYKPPHTLNFDRKPNKRAKVDSATLVPDVHVHIGGSTISTASSSSGVLGDSHVINFPSTMTTTEQSQACSSEFPSIWDDSFYNTSDIADSSNGSIIPPLTIHDALVVLDAMKPDGNYLKIEEELKAIGVSYIDDMLALDPQVIAEASHIPIIKVAVLINFAKEKENNGFEDGKTRFESFNVGKENYM